MNKPANLDWRMLWADFWRAPHRPLMVCAVLAALFGPFLALAASIDHSRLMIFGFAGAVVGAYLLTVLPGWTGVRASPFRIGVLVWLWILGRLFPGPVESLYFVFLAGILAPPVISKRLWDRLWSPIGAIGLAVAAAMPDLETGVPPLLVAAMIAVIGGKALPSFLASAADVQQPEDHVVLRVGTALCLIGAAVWGHPVWHLAAILGLVTQFITWPLKTSPIGWLLLPPWAWLICSLIFMIDDRIGYSLAMHTLTMGAIGGMIHAFLSRIFADRVSGNLIAKRASLVGAVFLHLSVLARLLDNLEIAYTAWTIAWIITFVQVVSHCLSPHKIPVFIGSRRRNPNKTQV